MNKNKAKNESWYNKNSGNHQGLIINEDTGESIAIVYNKKYAGLISASPDLLEAAEIALKEIEVMAAMLGNDFETCLSFDKLEEAIQKAREVSI